MRLDSSNVIDLLPDYDVIVDGADNFPTRYLLNDASVRLRKPVVSASILIRYQIEGSRPLGFCVPSSTSASASPLRWPL